MTRTLNCKLLAFNSWSPSYIGELWSGLFSFAFFCFFFFFGTFHNPILLFDGNCFVWLEKFAPFFRSWSLYVIECIRSHRSRLFFLFEHVHVVVDVSCLKIDHCPVLGDLQWQPIFWFVMVRFSVLIIFVMRISWALSLFSFHILYTC